MFLSAAVKNGEEDGAAALEAWDFPEGFDAAFFGFGASSSSSSSEYKPDAERADDREVERRSTSEGMEAASESLASSGTMKSSSSLVGLRFLSGQVVSGDRQRRRMREAHTRSLLPGRFFELLKLLGEYLVPDRYSFVLLRLFRRGSRNPAFLRSARGLQESRIAVRVLHGDLSFDPLRRKAQSHAMCEWE